MRLLLIEHDTHVTDFLVSAPTAQRRLLRRCQLELNSAAQHLDADLIAFSLNKAGEKGLALLRKLHALSDLPEPPPGANQSLGTVRDTATASGEKTRPVVQVADLIIDLRAHTVHVRRQLITLAPKEFDILALLAWHVGEAVSRDQVMLGVWGAASERISRSLDVHMTTLRAKLRYPRVLTTVRGFGYRLG